MLNVLFFGWYTPDVTAEPVIAGYVLQQNATSPLAWIGSRLRRAWGLAWWKICAWHNHWQMRLIGIVRVWSCRSLAEVHAVLTRRQSALQLGALPILLMMAERLKIRETINRYCPTQGQTDHGAVALVLVLNRLMAPRPLCKVADRLATTMLSAYLGVVPDKFNDDRLGRTLDALSEHL